MTRLKVVGGHGPAFDAMQVAPPPHFYHVTTAWATCRYVHLLSLPGREHDSTDLMQEQR